MKKSAIAFFAILVLVAAYGATSYLLGLRKPPETKAIERTVPVVEVMVVAPADIAIEIPSQGMVEPWRETRLAAEVGGRVKSVAPTVEAGQAVAAGDVLVELDDSDLLAALAAADARVAESELAVANEEAAATQAKRDWERLNLGGAPTALTLREPQLAAAKSNLAAARAARTKAQQDVDRTRIRAPFAGRIRAKLVESGTVVAPGTPVVEMFSTDSFKVRLPVPVDDAARVQRENGQFPAARFFSVAGGRRAEWKGRILRTEGEVDRASRSLYFVGELNPEGQSMSGDPVPLLPGLFVDAAIEGRVLENVVKLPRAALNDNHRVLVVGPDNLLRFRDVEVAWADRKEVYVSSGLAAGERVCLTTVEAVIDGSTAVRVAGEPASAPPAAAP